MGLPLFKGAGKELIHSVAEKTPLLFSKYTSGQSLVRAGHACSSVKCLLTGKVRISRTIMNGSLTVSYTIGPDIVLGVEHLFGLDTDYSFTAKALSDCGVMEISKKHYIDLLQSDRLLLLNYLNYLSLRAQKGIDILSNSDLQMPHSMFNSLICQLKEKHCSDIEIKANGISLLDAVGISEADLKRILTQT